MQCAWVCNYVHVHCTCNESTGDEPCQMYVHGLRTRIRKQIVHARSKSSSIQRRHKYNTFSVKHTYTYIYTVHTYYTSTHPKTYIQYVRTYMKEYTCTPIYRHSPQICVPVWLTWSTLPPNGAGEPVGAYMVSRDRATHTRTYSGTSVIRHLYNPTFSLIRPCYEVHSTCLTVLRSTG